MCVCVCVYVCVRDVCACVCVCECVLVELKWAVSQHILMSFHAFLLNLHLGTLE